MLALLQLEILQLQEFLRLPVFLQPQVHFRLLKLLLLLEITHHMNEAVSADRVLVMHKGGILADGSPAQVFSQVELLRRAGLDVPQTTDLLNELNKAGWAVPLNALTPEACAEAIAAVLRRDA